MFLKIELSLIRSPNVSAASWKYPFQTSFQRSAVFEKGKETSEISTDQNLWDQTCIVGQAFTLFW